MSSQPSDIRHQTYILGPCSAESREQVLFTAEQIKASCGDIPFIFRAGAWKPRTSPHTFQGVGDEALVWLQEVKARFGIPIATEVATPEHVEKALKAGIDYVWIGARTSASPIAVEAIAQALKDHPLKGVLIKNPVNADAQLWLGNIERLEKTGIPVMAVHRGCNHQPCWSLAHAIRTQRPDIPLLLDPSHMSGNAAKVPELMSKIEELSLDGAMIEVHCDPANALSDNAQQITPDRINHLITSIALPDHPRLYTYESPTQDLEELNWLRAEIDELDDRLWDTISARMEVSKRIGAWKKAHGVAPLQPERYRQIADKVQQKGDFALRIWDLIHEESLKQQE